MEDQDRRKMQIYRSEIPIVPKLNRKLGFELTGRSAKQENTDSLLMFINDKGKAYVFFKKNKTFQGS